MQKEILFGVFFTASEEGWGREQISSSYTTRLAPIDYMSWC